MMIDHITIRELSNLKVQEFLSQAEANRKIKSLPTEPGFAASIVTMVSGLMRRTEPKESAPAVYTDVRRATAEIPGL